MSELFGLPHSHSSRAEALRDRVAALEVKVLDDVAEASELKEYKEKKARLPENMDELADRSIRALIARGAE